MFLLRFQVIRPFRTVSFFSQMPRWYIMKKQFIFILLNNLFYQILSNDLLRGESGR